MTEDAAVLLERSIDHQPGTGPGIHVDLLYPHSAQRLPGRALTIRYDQVTLRKRIPGFAPGKEFCVAILDPIEGTLALYRDYDYDPLATNKPSVVVRVHLVLSKEPSERP